MPKRSYFLDANVIISGLLWNGNERELLLLGENQKIVALTSAYVLKQVEDVLHRMNFDDIKITEFLVYLRSFTQLIDASKDDAMKYWDVLNDKTDVPILAAAIISKCILVTGDRELLEKGSSLIEVINAKKALENEKI
jgi:putative PIN family toxin of toxin-antitoxin system